MSKDLEELQKHKSEVLLESNINREIIAIECNQLRIKAGEWRGSLTKAGTVYKWVAPLGGLALGFLAARRQVNKAQARAPHNGHARGKLNYLGLLGPLGGMAVRQAIHLWRQARKSRPRGASASN